MRKFLALCLCCIILMSCYSNFCYADPLTIAGLGATAFAMQSYYGISFNAINATSSGMGNWMNDQIENYVNDNGGSLTSLFGAEQARLIAGKLVVGQTMANGIADFTDWLVDKYGLVVDYFSELSKGVCGGQPFDTVQSYDDTESIPQYGFYATFGVPYKSGFKGCYIYVDGVRVQSLDSGSNQYFDGDWYVGTFEENSLKIYVHRWAYTGESLPDRDIGYMSSKVLATIEEFPIANQLSWEAGSDYVAPIVLNPTEHWEGEIDGWTGPDTNIGDLFDNILEGVADTTISVDGEVVEDIPPQPTPVPIDPDLPLQDVPWEGLDTNLQNLYNQGLEEIGAIGDAQDAITDAVAEQTGVLEDALSGNAGIVSGAIGQAVSDIQDAISEQTETLSESSAATAEATESIADALEDETINWQKFDLSGLFPFCIPFDIYNMLEALDASPTAPHVELPFVIDSINFSYTIDLDFSAFDQVAAVMRQMELIAYAIALAWATSKVIKW